jgi:hypothetical protein
MYQFVSNHFFKITNSLEHRSNGNAKYGNQDEPNWADIMQTGRFCRIYGLYEDAIQALLDSVAKSVIFYAVAKTYKGGIKPIVCPQIDVD